MVHKGRIYTNTENGHTNAVIPYSVRQGRVFFKGGLPFGRQVFFADNISDSLPVEEFERTYRLAGDDGGPKDD